MKNIITDTYTEIIQICDEDIHGDLFWDEYPKVEVFGITVFEEQPKIAKFIGKDLYLDNVIVTDFYEYPELENNIPCHYVVRKFNGQYMRFICGLDLLKSGESWNSIDRIKRDTFLETWDYLKSTHGDIKLFLEEPMKI